MMYDSNTLGATDTSSRMITVFQSNCGRVDLEEYIFTVLAIANANSELDLVDIAFEVRCTFLSVFFIKLLHAER